MPNVAVIDVETTGLNPYRHDRVVEIAVVVIEPDGTVVREFCSLINPERDIGPTSIHGLSANDVTSAPRFSEIAGALLEVAEDCVAFAGHNIRFDHSFLAAEFNRLGHRIPDGPMLCTLQLAGGGSLSACCSCFDIPFKGQAHSALDDAKATAQLLAKLLKDEPRYLNELAQLSPIMWPRVPRTVVQTMSRDDSRRRQDEPPSYLQKLLARAGSDLLPNTDDGALLAYSALLDRVLEDRRIDDSEGEALLEVATRWGIDGKQIQDAHGSYLHHLAIAALADGVVTDSERRDLALVAKLLGIRNTSLNDMLDRAAEKLAYFSPLPQTASVVHECEALNGKRVCFTGEFQCCLNGEMMTRETASGLATQQGLIVVESVTKKLDLLVIADPHTQSGKANKARQYGIRIMHEPLFWKTLGVEVD